LSLREGGGLKKFYPGRLRAEVQPLTLLFTIFEIKGTPFIYRLLTNDTPFTYLEFLELYSPLNCWKCTVFKIRIKHKTRAFSRHFHGHKMYKLDFAIDCQQSLFFFRFGEGSGGARECQAANLRESRVLLDGPGKRETASSLISFRILQLLKSLKEFVKKLRGRW